MPIDHILPLLISERKKLNRAIEALHGPVKRRGRPPRNPVSIFRDGHSRNQTASRPPAEVCCLIRCCPSRPTSRTQRHARRRAQGGVRTDEEVLGSKAQGDSLSQ